MIRTTLKSATKNNEKLQNTDNVEELMAQQFNATGIIKLLNASPATKMLEVLLIFLVFVLFEPIETHFKL